MIKQPKLCKILLFINLHNETVLTPRHLSGGVHLLFSSYLWMYPTMLSAALQEHCEKHSSATFGPLFFWKGWISTSFSITEPLGVWKELLALYVFCATDIFILTLRAGDKALLPEPQDSEGSSVLLFVLHQSKSGFSFTSDTFIVYVLVLLICRPWRTSRLRFSNERLYK